MVRPTEINRYRDLARDFRARPGTPSVRAQRTHALLKATVASPGLSTSTNCIVNDISDIGARITISASIPLTAEFQISIPQKKISRIARLVWRSGDQVGLAFALERDAATAQAGKARDDTLRSMEQEIAALKAEIGVLRYHIYLREEL